MAIAGTVYTSADWPAHIVVVPEIAPAAAGNGVTVMGKVDADPSPQELIPFTVILPEVAEIPYSTVILLDVLVPVAPPGRVQL